MHHNKVEIECNSDIHNIIKLISLYKVIIFNLNNQESNLEIKNLKNDYERCKEMLDDSNYFNAVAGEEFEKLQKI